MLEDPFGEDRRVSEVARASRSFRAELRRGRGTDHTFEHVGRVFSLERLSELADSAGDPLAPALLRFAARFHEEHALIELEVAHAAAVRVVRHPVDHPERGEFTLDEFVRHALANTKGQRAAFLDLLFERGEKARELAERRAERRSEVRESMAERVAPNFDLPGDAVVEAAARFLERTQDAFAALGTGGFADVLELGLGRESRATWPARVTPRAVAELLREGRWVEHVETSADAEYPAFGAASFLRGLWSLGAAFRAGLAAVAKRPFVLTHDAFGLDRATFGALFASLPQHESFSRRMLAVSPAAMADHRRTLGRVLIVGAREAALRVVLRAPSLGGRKTLERAHAEQSHLALGVELPPNALGTLFTPRPGDAQRFAGMLLGAEIAHTLTTTHDEDWYRNPRAVEEVRERARLPAESNADTESLERGAALLAAHVTETL